MSDKEKIDALLERMKIKDEEDYEHSLRVGDIVTKFVEKLDIQDDEKSLICSAALLHDIGILELDDYLLKKNRTVEF